jgi:hypothetical protein
MRVSKPEPFLEERFERADRVRFRGRVITDVAALSLLDMFLAPCLAEDRKELRDEVECEGESFLLWEFAMLAKLEKVTV